MLNSVYRKVVSMSSTVIPLTHTIDPQLRQVDEIIREALCTPSSSLQRMVDHLLCSSGKKIRPMLVLLSGRLFDSNDNSFKKSDALLNTAAAVELIHTASLVHDDIIDGADHRRGHATLHTRWDYLSATLVGDYLLSRAFNLLSNMEQNKILVPLMARSVALLCRGEARQLDKSFDWSISEQEYFRCNYLKTSQFLAACCEAGGRVAKALPSQIRALCEYGFNLGQAFQIVDDILDFSEQPENLGKPVGADLSQGVVTLPLICLARSRGRYLALFNTLRKRRSHLSHEINEQIRQAVIGSGALRYSARKAELAREAALKALQALPPSPARNLLAQITEAVTNRMGDAGKYTPDA
jgi:geranylgeranyl pyrophosphate synthase